MLNNVVYFGRDLLEHQICVVVKNPLGDFVVFFFFFESSKNQQTNYNIVLRFLGLFSRKFLLILFYYIYWMLRLTHTLIRRNADMISWQTRGCWFLNWRFSPFYPIQNTTPCVLFWLCFSLKRTQLSPSSSYYHTEKLTWRLVIPAAAVCVASAAVVVVAITLLLLLLF